MRTPHHFVVNLYHQSDCNDDNLSLSHVVDGFAPGATDRGFTNPNVDAEYNWKAHPFIFDGCDASDLLWSPCARISVKKKYVPPAPHYQCGEYVAAGGIYGETHHIDMGQTSGTFLFHWDAIDIPDRIIVYHEHPNMPLFDNGCAGGQGDVTLSCAGTTSIITVVVNPTCDYTCMGHTEWNFTVHCPE